MDDILFGKTVLVTGATGLLGGAVAKMLLKEGYQVRAMTRDLPRAQSLANLGAEVVQAYMTDLLSLERAVSGCQVVLHFAAALAGEFAGEAYFHKVNVEGALCLAQAALAADLALRHPEQVKSLILVSTRLKRQTQLSWSGLLVDLALRIPLLQRMDKYPQPYYASVRQCEATRNYDCTDRLPEIRVPTLILHGKKDRIAPYRLAEEMHAGIKGSKIITFNGGHIFLFFQPRQFTAAIVEFLGG